MSEYRVASRYAKSLITLSSEKGVLEEIHKDIKLFSQVCLENRDFTLMLKSPIIESEKKSQIIKQLFKDRVHKMTMSFYDIITKKNREKFLPAIAREFHIQYNISHKIGMAKVTTVFPLDDSLRADFKRLILNFTDENTLELEEEIDPELIGGYQLKIGWNQIDESLRGKLNKLKLKFS